jgi:hypothetical protein
MPTATLWHPPPRRAQVPTDGLAVIIMDYLLDREWVDEEQVRLGLGLGPGVRSVRPLAGPRVGGRGAGKVRVRVRVGLGPGVRSVRPLVSGARRRSGNGSWQLCDWQMGLVFHRRAAWAKQDERELTGSGWTAPIPLSALAHRIVLPGATKNNAHHGSFTPLSLLQPEGLKSSRSFMRTKCARGT